RLAENSLPWREAAALVETLARAVHYAHRKGVVHRDLKPSNVLLAFSRETPASAGPALAGVSRLNEAVPKLVDFCLAKQLGAATGGAAGPHTQTGAVLGTPAYMAPEQAEGKGHAVGPAADVYALGVILYECLTGKTPFRAGTTVDLLLKVV